MTKEIFEDVIQWQKETFKQSTSLSKLAHLKQELEEVTDSIIEGKYEETKAEFADCFILLFGAASIFGMDYEDLEVAIREKMIVNKARKWGKPDKDGVVNHVK